MLIYPVLSDDDWLVKVLTGMIRRAMVWGRYRHPLRPGRHDRGWPKVAA